MPPRQRSAEPRNYEVEMRAFVKAECTGRFIAAQKAAEIIAKLRAADPDLLIGWSEQKLVSNMLAFINLGNRLERGNARRAAQRAEVRGRFERALASGDTSELRAPSPATVSLLNQRFKVHENGLQMLFGETGKPERLYIIDMYAGNANSNAFEWAYHRAVQKRARDRITGDVFTDESLTSLRQALPPVDISTVL